MTATALALAGVDTFRNRIINCDAMTLARSMPSQSIQTIITSPPYFGLRSYIPDSDPSKHLEIGLEETPDMYIMQLVMLFRELGRALRNNGTVWLNLGDSYASDIKGSGGPSDKQLSNKGSRYQPRKFKHGLKDKDLIGIPWRVAIALQADGWYLRSDIIWNKINAMPESVRDRPSKSHEYVFLLSKSSRYMYNADSVNTKGVSGGKVKSYSSRDTRLSDKPEMVNLRSVWSTTTGATSVNHFAAFPPDLIKRMVLAGSKEGDIVYDPFMGSGTTALVSRMLGRDYIGSELSSEYVTIARQRLAAPYTPDMFTALEKSAAPKVEQHALFANESAPTA